MTIEATTEIKDSSTGRVVNAPITAPDVPVPASGPMSFDAYCSARSVRVDHRRGMRAYAKRDEATLAEWDEIFKTY